MYNRRNIQLARTQSGSEEEDSNEDFILDLVQADNLVKEISNKPTNLPEKKSQEHSDNARMQSFNKDLDTSLKYAIDDNAEPNDEKVKLPKINNEEDDFLFDLVEKKEQQDMNKDAILCDLVDKEVNGLLDANHDQTDIPYDLVQTEVNREQDSKQEQDDDFLYDLVEKENKTYLYTNDIDHVENKNVEVHNTEDIFEMVENDINVKYDETKEDQESKSKEKEFIEKDDEKEDPNEDMDLKKNKNDEKNSNEEEQNHDILFEMVEEEHNARHDTKTEQADNITLDLTKKEVINEENDAFDKQNVSLLDQVEEDGKEEHYSQEKDDMMFDLLHKETDKDKELPTNFTELNNGPNDVTSDSDSDDMIVNKDLIFDLVNTEYSKELSEIQYSTNQTKGYIELNHKGSYSQAVTGKTKEEKEKELHCEVENNNMQTMDSSQLNEISETYEPDCLEIEINDTIVLTNEALMKNSDALTKDLLMDLVNSELDSEEIEEEINEEIDEDCDESEGSCQDFLYDLVKNENISTDNANESELDESNEDFLMKLVQQDMKTDKKDNQDQSDILMDFVSSEMYPYQSSSAYQNSYRMTYIINKHREENIIHSFSDLSDIKEAMDIIPTFGSNNKKCYEVTVNGNDHNGIPTDAFDMQEFSCMLSIQNQSQEPVINNSFVIPTLLVQSILDDLIDTCITEDDNNNSIKEKDMLSIEDHVQSSKDDSDSLEQKDKSCDEEIIQDIKVSVDDYANDSSDSDSSSSYETENVVKYCQVATDVNDKFPRTLPTIEEESESKSEPKKKVKTFLAINDDLTVVEKYALKSETSESVDGKSPEAQDRVDKLDFDYKDESIPFESFDVFGEKEEFNHEVKEVEEIREGCKVSLTLTSSGFDRKLMSYVFTFPRCLLAIIGILMLDFIIFLIKATFHLYLYYLHNLNDIRLPDSPGVQADVPKLELEENLSSDSDPSCGNIAREYSKIETIREESDQQSFEKSTKTEIEVVNKKDTVLNSLIKHVITTEIIENNISSRFVNSVKSSRFSVKPVFEEAIVVDTVEPVNNDIVSSDGGIDMLFLIEKFIHSCLQIGK